MIRFLFKLGLSLVVLLLVYNYFLGTPEEKSTSKKIFGEVIHLGKSSWDLLRVEKQKLRDGKYDVAMDKVSQLLNGLENAVIKSGDPKINDQFQDLTDKRDQLLQLEETSTNLNNTAEADAKLTEKEKSERLRLLKTLLSETELLMNQLENR
jgi:lipopolysaccharide export LptBFGC system permease protein LptF